MSTPVTIATAYPGWEVYQQHLIAAVAPLTTEQLNTRLAPHLRSVMELAAHIISARVWWFHVVMGEGPESLKPMVEWDDEGARARTAAELVAGLEVTWDLIRSCLARWTAADLEQAFVRPGGGILRERAAGNGSSGISWSMISTTAGSYRFRWAPTTCQRSISR